MSETINSLLNDYQSEQRINQTNTPGVILIVLFEFLLAANAHRNVRRVGPGEVGPVGEGVGSAGTFCRDIVNRNSSTTILLQQRLLSGKYRRGRVAGNDHCRNREHSLDAESSTNYDFEKSYHCSEMHVEQQLGFGNAAIIHLQKAA
jgi:hypothetical protein